MLELFIRQLKPINQGHASKWVKESKQCMCSSTLTQIKLGLNLIDLTEDGLEEQRRNTNNMMLQ